MRGIIILWLCGLLFLCQFSTTKSLPSACQMKEKDKDKTKEVMIPTDCIVPMEGSSDFGDDTEEDLDQTTQTEEQRLNETEQLNSSQTKHWHPFSSKASRFAPQAENKEKTKQTEEQRLNETQRLNSTETKEKLAPGLNRTVREVLWHPFSRIKGSRFPPEAKNKEKTNVEQSTASPKTRAKRTTTDSYPDWHYFGSGPGSRFAPQTEEEQRNTTKDLVLNVTEIFNGTTSEQTTPLPTTTVTTAKVETTTDFVWHPFSSGVGVRFAPHSKDNDA